jgi:hypothetical protein
MHAGGWDGSTHQDGTNGGVAAAVPAVAPEVLETVVSPFHCFYQDALEFHQLSKLRAAQSDAESSRLARAALVLYVAGAESLLHQAAAELGRPDLSRLICDPRRPMPLDDAWRLLPSLVGDAPPGYDAPETPPWPQFRELLELRSAWAYPGFEAQRRAYYLRDDPASDFRPLDPRETPASLRLPAEQLVLPRTGLPRDPYALRAHHLDTVRGILDAAIAALDRRLGGLLTRDGRHRREPCRIVHPAPRRG